MHWVKLNNHKDLTLNAKPHKTTTQDREIHANVIDGQNSGMATVQSSRLVQRKKYVQLLQLFNKIMDFVYAMNEISNYNN